MQAKYAIMMAKGLFLDQMRVLQLEGRKKGSVAREAIFPTRRMPDDGGYIAPIFL